MNYVQISFCVLVKTLNPIGILGFSMSFPISHIAMRWRAMAEAGGIKAGDAIGVVHEKAGMAGEKRKKAQHSLCRAWCVGETLPIPAPLPLG